MKPGEPEASGAIEYALGSTASGKSTESAKSTDSGKSSPEGSSGSTLSSGTSGESYRTALSSVASSEPALSAQATGEAAASASPAPKHGFASAHLESVQAAATCDPRNTNLNHFHSAVRYEHLSRAGKFTKVKSISGCLHDGKVELHEWRRCGLEDGVVVVKTVASPHVNVTREQEANERLVQRCDCKRDREDTLNEIGVYSYLFMQQDVPAYILKMHMAFERGVDVWLVLEHADGGDLFNVVKSVQSRDQNPMALQQLRLWMWQLMQAVAYLHRHHIGHRDISIENVLLCGGVVRVMDFGQAVRTHTPQGELHRYFLPVGKHYYRPTECYVPKETKVQVVVPNGPAPGQIALAHTTDGKYMCDVLLPKVAPPGEKCLAEPWGYTAPAVDVFACGVCLFIMATGTPPWRHATLQDKNYVWMLTKGGAALVQAWQKAFPPRSGDLLVRMLAPVPTKRPTAAECLEHPWFEPLRGMPIPVHEVSAAAMASTAADAAAEDAADPMVHHDDVNMTGMAGDFYRMPDVVRCEETWSTHQDIWAPLGKEGPDYYAEEYLGTDHQAAFGGLSGGDFYRDLNDAAGAEAAQDPEGAPDPANPLPLQRFSDDAAPREVPADARFRLEPTTMYFSGSTPADVGNHLLSFFASATWASVTKVSCRKYAIKADVDGDAGACSLKVRIYRAGSGRHAMEFQRRSGDSMALHDVFQQASAYLEGLVRALTPHVENDSSDVSCAGSDDIAIGDVELSLLRDWVDPGVRGLLQRNRRRQQDHLTHDGALTDRPLHSQGSYKPPRSAPATCGVRPKGPTPHRPRRPCHKAY